MKIEQMDTDTLREFIQHLRENGYSVVPMLTGFVCRVDAALIMVAYQNADKESYVIGYDPRYFIVD
jgi:hypothetical protein